MCGSTSQKKVSHYYYCFTKLLSFLIVSFYPLGTGDEAKAICKYCNANLSSRRNAGTNHLRRHVNACMQNLGLKLPSDKREWKFSQEASRELLAKMIIVHEYPF